MSEATRIMVWEQIQASELVGSDVVPLSIETAKLLLECARIINEGASSIPMHTPQKPVPITPRFHVSDEALRKRCIDLSLKL